MAEWTREMVEARLAEAAEVLKSQPAVKVQGYFNLWPRIRHEFADLVGRELPRMKRPLPSPAAIDRMEETIGWLRWLEPEDAKLLWARAEGTPWKGVCWRFGIARATAHRRWEYALSVIAWRLQGRKVPTKRSREFLIERVRSASSGIR